MPAQVFEYVGEGGAFECELALQRALRHVQVAGHGFNTAKAFVLAIDQLTYLAHEAVVQADRDQFAFALLHGQLHGGGIGHDQGQIEVGGIEGDAVAGLSERDLRGQDVAELLEARVFGDVDVGFTEQGFAGDDLGHLPEANHEGGDGGIPQGLLSQCRVEIQVGDVALALQTQGKAHDA